MKHELIDDMVPVSVNNMKDIWYIDVSNLSLSELIELKEDLKGYSIQSIRVLDAIIHKNAGTTFEETNFNDRQIRNMKKGCRNQKALIKLRKKNRR